MNLHKECPHSFEREEYRDGGHQLIEIYWCFLCGALKRKVTTQGMGEEVTIKLPQGARHPRYPSDCEKHGAY